MNFFVISYYLRMNLHRVFNVLGAYDCVWKLVRVRFQQIRLDFSADPFDVN